MSAETLNPSTEETVTSGLKDRGAETARGQEVTSKTGNLIDRVAHRLLNLSSRLDQAKAGAIDMKDTTLDQLAVGRAYAEDMGQKAVAGIIAGGELTVGLAILGGEAVGRGAKKADAWLEAKSDALGTKIDNGIDRAVDWVDTGAIAIGERIDSGVESVKNFFKEKAEAAKLRRAARRERWNQRISRGREIVDSTVEKGAVFVQATRKRGNAAFKAARAAQIVYSANVAQVPGAERA